MTRLSIEQTYLDSVAHLHAADAWTFVICIGVYLALCVFAFWRSDRRDNQS